MINYSTDQIMAELWLGRALRDRGIPNPNAGLTSLEERKDNFRFVINKYNLESEIAGWKKGYPQKFGEVFARIYNEPFNGVEDEKVETESNESA